MNVRTLARPKSFRDEIDACVRTTDPADLTAALADLCEGHMAPLREQARATAAEATEAHASHRGAAHMLVQTETLAAQLTQQVTRHAAVIAQQRDTLTKVRALAQKSFDGRLSAEDVAALLTTPLNVPDCHQVPLAFTPSAQFRGGVFANLDRSVMVTYTFVGWTHVMKYVGGGISNEPTFLVDGRGALPASTIELERDLKLDYPLLPPLASLAAAA